MTSRYLYTVVAALFLCGAILIIATHLKYGSCLADKRKDWLKYSVFVFVITSFLTISHLPPLFLTGLLALISLAALKELYEHLPHTSGGLKFLLAILPIIIAVCLGHLVVIQNGDGCGLFAFVILTVGISDGFSQLWGRLLGRKRMCPQISPAKTWGGFFGGVISALVGIFLLAPMFPPNISLSMILLLGLITALAAVAGDLTFSYIKRRLGIKDFSGTLPGHGGVLDRFDSLIMAAPVFFWIWRLLVK